MHDCRERTSADHVLGIYSYNNYSVFSELNLITPSLVCIIIYSMYFVRVRIHMVGIWLVRPWQWKSIRFCHNDKNKLLRQCITLRLHTYTRKQESNIRTLAKQSREKKELAFGRKRVVKKATINKFRYVFKPVLPSYLLLIYTNNCLSLYRSLI